MMIELPAKMNKLLDEVLDDLPVEKLDLYSLLDTPEFTDHFDNTEDDFVMFQDFVASVIAYFDINYGKTLHKHLFAALVMDIFGPIEMWEDIDPIDFEERKEMLLEAMQTITFQELPQGHIDYDMVYVMLEKDLQDD